MSKSSPAGKKPLALIFFLTALAVFLGISFLAPNWGQGELPTNTFLDERVMIITIRAVLAVLVGLAITLRLSMAQKQANQGEQLRAAKAQSKAVPRISASGQKRFEADLQKPKSTSNIVYWVETNPEGITTAIISIKNMTGGQFKKQGGLRSKIEAISSVKWQHPKNDIAKKTILISGPLKHGANKKQVIASLEKIGGEPFYLAETMADMFSQ